jgi:hypothetical protein
LGEDYKIDKNSVDAASDCGYGDAFVVEKFLDLHRADLNGDFSSSAFAGGYPDVIKVK